MKIVTSISLGLGLAVKVILEAWGNILTCLPRVAEFGRTSMPSGDRFGFQRKNLAFDNASYLVISATNKVSIRDQQIQGAAIRVACVKVSQYAGRSFPILLGKLAAGDFAGQQELVQANEHQAGFHSLPWR